MRSGSGDMVPMITIGAVAEVVLTLWEHLDTIQLVRRGPLAQLVEQRPFKAWVTGSNPVWLNEPTPCKSGSFFMFGSEGRSGSIFGSPLFSRWVFGTRSTVGLYGGRHAVVSHASLVVPLKQSYLHRCLMKSLGCL